MNGAFAFESVKAVYLMARCLSCGSYNASLPSPSMSNRFSPTWGKKKDTEEPPHNQTRTFPKFVGRHDRTSSRVRETT